MDGYIAFIHPPEGGSRSWGVTFPDLPGCVSMGSSLEDAARSAREALSGHLAAMRADGDIIPLPRTWEAIACDKAEIDEADGAHVQYVEPRGLKGERLRVNVMIDKGLLREADEAADAAGLTRSGYIEAALLSYGAPAR